MGRRMGLLLLLDVCTDVYADDKHVMLGWDGTGVWFIVYII